MNFRRWFILFLIAACWANPAWADDQRVSQRARLTGTWVITFHIAEGPEFLPRTITLLGNFTRDGNFIFSTDLPILDVPTPFGDTEPVKVGEGHGTWRRAGFREFELQSTALVQMAMEPETLIGFGGGSAKFRLAGDGDRILGSVRLQLRPIAGEPLPPGIGKLEGRRLFH